jgi:hypothetical protein
MLREIPNTRQIEGEPRRAWYFSHDLDLVVWFDAADAPCGFQLAYDKYRGEHSITWNRDTGFRHYMVDDGEKSALNSATPFLYADGPFPRDTVLERFVALSGELPPGIAAFVADRLRDFDGPTLP